MGASLLAADLFGAYTNAWKALPFLLVFLIWVRLLTWVDKDAKRALLPRTAVNAGTMSGLLLAVALFFVVPNYILALFGFLAIFGIEAGVYLALRSQKIGLGDLQAELTDGLTSLIPKSGEGKSKNIELPGQLVIVARGGRHLTQPDDEDPTRLGYDLLQLALYDPMMKQAQTIDVFPTETGAATRFWVDGVAYEGVTMERGPAGEMLAFLKSIVGLDPEEVRKPQRGEFKLILDGERHDVRVVTMGSKAGESARFEINVPRRYQFKAEELGFTSSQLQTLEALRDEPGLVLLACPKGHGLTTLQYAMVRFHDAFISHILTVEKDAPIDLEGITQNKLPAGTTPQEEAKTVAWVASQEPDVLLVSNPESQQSARSIVDFCNNGKRAYVAIRANDVFEAVEVWKRLVGDASEAVTPLKLVIVGRLFRRLCDATKEPYQPDERLLRQLGLGSGQVAELYKPHFGPLIDARGHEVPDTFCFGLGYKGRFGVYEILKVDDEVRESYLSGASLTQLRQLFRKQRGRYIQELALARVAAGDTSVQEFLRVLKPGNEAAGGSAAGKIV